MNKLLTILIIFTVGCSKNNENNRKVILTNNLGQISITLPSEFDTVETWIKKSDYHCGDKQIYRLSDSRFDLYKSTNEYDFHHYDSVFQFAIIHDAYLECVSSSFPIQKLLESMTESAKFENTVDPLLKSEIMKINGRDFAVIERISYKDTIQIYFLSCTTLIRDSIDLNFGFGCAKSDCQDFIKTANESIKTIKINE